MSEEKEKPKTNLVKIQDFHPNPKIRLAPPQPRSWRNDSGTVEVFSPEVDEEGRVFYSVPAAYARRLFSSDQVGRYILISPAELQYARTINLASTWKTVKASKPKTDKVVDEARDAAEQAAREEEKALEKAAATEGQNVKVPTPTVGGSSKPGEGPVAPTVAPK
jgi:hypothetical protein